MTGVRCVRADALGSLADIGVIVGDMSTPKQMVAARTKVSGRRSEIGQDAGERNRLGFSILLDELAVDTNNVCAGARWSCSLHRRRHTAEAPPPRPYAAGAATAGQPGAAAHLCCAPAPAWIALRSAVCSSARHASRLSWASSARPGAR